MKQNKGFTTIELIIVIAIIAIIMLIGSAAYAGITFRQQVNSDRASAQQIGKAIDIAEVDGRGENIPVYPNIIRYSEIGGIDNYVQNDLIPQSSPKGYYFATKIPTQAGIKTAVGIATGTEGEEMAFGNIYNGKKSGFTYTAGKEITQFIEEVKAEGGEFINQTSDLPSVELLSSVAPVGSYVAYTPSSTSYTVLASESGHTSNQTYNPSTATSWKIFKNSSGKVEIISSESIGSLTLRGQVGYKKLVNTLNNLSSAYVNPAYAVSGRSIGSAPSSTGEITADLVHGQAGAPYSDTLDTADRAIINANTSLRHSSGYVWLASRLVDIYSSASGFYARGWHANGEVYGYILCYVNSAGGIGTSSSEGGVRPVVTLKSGVRVTGGSGTAGDPYTISM